MISLASSSTKYSVYIRVALEGDVIVACSENIQWMNNDCVQIIIIIIMAEEQDMEGTDTAEVAHLGVNCFFCGYLKGYYY